MSPLILPLHLLLMMFAGWLNRHQLEVIEYLQEENRLLKERLGGGGACASPMPSVADWPEEPTRSDARSRTSLKPWSRRTRSCDEQDTVAGERNGLVIP
jgi:hypothetical protein